MVGDNNFAFIDGQNLHTSILKQGWKPDYRRFRVYLKDKLRVTKAFLFIGYIKDNQDLYAALRRDGYILIFRPTLEYAPGKVKGNVDADLVLQAMIEFDNYDRAVIVAGDGDYYSLIKYLLSKNKMANLVIPDRYNYSSLLRKLSCRKLYMNGLEGKIGYKKGRH